MASCSCRLSSPRQDLRTRVLPSPTLLSPSSFSFPLSTGPLPSVINMDEGLSLKTKTPKATWPQGLIGPFIFSSQCLVGIIFAYLPLISPQPSAVSSHWAAPALAQDPSNSPAPAPAGVRQALLVWIPMLYFTGGADSP